MIQEDRALWKYIVFGFLTCGIYNFYFIYKMAQDVNEMCADDGKKTSGLVVFILLSYLTCGIYTLIWYYSLANRLAENAPRYGLQFQENGTTVLMWHIFGMLLCGIGAFIAMNILIKNTNAMAKAYNGHGGNRDSGKIRNRCLSRIIMQKAKPLYCLWIRIRVRQHLRCRQKDCCTLYRRSRVLLSRKTSLRSVKMQVWWTM